MNTDDIRRIQYRGDYEYVPAGKYQAIVAGWEESEFFKKRKLYVWFEIIDPGPHMGKRIFLACNAFSRITRNSKYYEIWVLANGNMRPARNSRMSPRVFLNKVFLISVRTVFKGRKDNLLSDDHKYSVVDEVLELCTR